MCKYIYAPGSHDLVIGIKKCDDPKCPIKNQTVTLITPKKENKA